MSSTGISGSACVTRCSDTAACAPKLDDSANGPGRFSSAQRTRVAASTEASQSLMRLAASASAANSRGVSVRRGAPASDTGAVLIRRLRARRIRSRARLRLEHVRAPQEIAEAFVRVPLRRVTRDELIERGDDGRSRRCCRDTARSAASRRHRRRGAACSGRERGR